MLKFLRRLTRPQNVVYTSLFGRYENLNEQPVAASSDWDFICFTDNTELRSDTWTIKVVQPLGIDPARESRRPKLQPHRYLQDYDRSLYIDNAAVLKKTPEEICAGLDLDIPFHCIRHPWRDCAFDEAEIIIAAHIDDEIRVREQMDFYRPQLPKNAGLIAGTMLLRSHNDPKLMAHGDSWLAHVLRFSKRDQLAFPFTAQMHDLRYNALSIELAGNELFDWPMRHQRLPYGFSPDLYLWLNADVARAGVDPVDHYRSHGAAENRPIRYHSVFDLERLANLYRSDKGRLYYNRHFYSRVYERYLNPMRAADITVMEIGLLRHDMQARNPNGPFNEAPSLYMWRDYFTQAEIHGLDINDFSQVESGRIKFTRCDQSNIDDLARAVERSSKPLKVIIDDGLHASPHQQISLGFLFEKLEPGGFYFIEDLHYQPANFEPADAVKTRGILKAIAAGKDVPASQYLSSAQVDYLRQHVETIDFFDSMDFNAADGGADAIAVLRKRSA